MRKLIKQLFCNHHWEWKHNVYGDAINYFNCRSIWKCDKCGVYGTGKSLMPNQKFSYKDNIEWL
jgi:ribosomal protein L37AE/L43A